MLPKHPKKVWLPVGVNSRPSVQWTKIAILYSKFVNGIVKIYIVFSSIISFEECQANWMRNLSSSHPCHGTWSLLHPDALGQILIPYSSPTLSVVVMHMYLGQCCKEMHFCLQQTLTWIPVTRMGQIPASHVVQDSKGNNLRFVSFEPRYNMAQRTQAFIAQF